MSRRGSAGTIFWGFTLIVAGVIFLLKNLGYDVPVWTGVARYWPVLLIVWGLIKLIDYYRWKRAGQTGTLFSGGEVVLLVLVILAGSALTTAANLSPDIGDFFEIANIDLFDITGNAYEYTEHYEQDARSGAEISIINRYGGVEVQPALTDRIIVDVRKTVIASDQKQADELSKLLTFSIMDRERGYNIWSSFNRDDNRVRGRRFKTTVTVQVPKNAALTVDNRNGLVKISDLIGDQKITNGFGPVDIRNIAGSIEVNSRNDEVIVEEINGSATIKNEFASTTVRNVTGRLQLRNRNGDVEVSGVKADVEINNEFAAVRVSDVQGPLLIRSKHGSIEVDGVEDSVNVRTEFEQVRVADVKGEVNITNRNGGIVVSFRQPPRNNVQVTSEFDEVTIELPASSAFTIDARTQHGELASEFTEPRISTDNDRSSLSGSVGSGGPEIRINNRHGNVRLVKR